MGNSYTMINSDPGKSALMSLQTLFPKLAPLVLAVLAGCAYTRPIQIVPMQAGPKERPVATVRGQATAAYLLGIRLSGDDSLAEAIEDAKRNAAAKSGNLVNVFVDREIWWPFIPIYWEITTSLYGTLVTYDDPWFHDVTKAATESAKNSGSANSADLETFLRSLKKGTLVVFKYREGGEATLEFVNYDPFKGEIWVKPPGGGIWNNHIIAIDKVAEAHAVVPKQ